MMPQSPLGPHHQGDHLVSSSELDNTPNTAPNNETVHKPHCEPGHAPNLAQNYELQYSEEFISLEKPLLAEAYYWAPPHVAVARLYRKAFRFKGYASRSEVAYAVLFQAVVFCSVIFALLLTAKGDDISVLGYCAIFAWGFFLINLISNLSLFWRRLHDMGLPGYIALPGFALLCFVRPVGIGLLLLMMIWPTSYSRRRIEWEEL